VSNEFRDLVRSSSRSTQDATSVARAISTPASGAVPADDGFWVAVLPFKYGGSNSDLTALADGLTEDIITGMSRFPYLKVIARSSTSRFANPTIDVRTAAKELSARHVMEGNLRQAGTRLRIAVQLVDAITGAHLWAETYERGFQPEPVFELQDELVPRIVSTASDTHGVLPHSMSEMLRDKDPGDLTPYEAVLRSFAYFHRICPGEHAAMRDALELAVEQAPGYALAWAMLAILQREEYAHSFNAKPDPLGRAFASARRAVECAPSNHMAHHALAGALFYRGEIQAFHGTAERALALNPMDGFTSGYLGLLTVYSGEWERGCALAQRARSLNPSHPGWFWFADFFTAFHHADYLRALEFALKLNMPRFWRAHFALAATYGQLGEPEKAQKALQGLLSLGPEFGAITRQECETYWEPDLAGKLLEGLRKAGLEIPKENESAVPAIDTSLPAAMSGSGAARTDEGFRVAVLPFKFTGDAKELKALADGVSEEIVTGLSRFSYLRVVARGSTAKYSSESGDVRATHSIRGGLA